MTYIDRGRGHMWAKHVTMTATVIGSKEFLAA
jgi:hypothetical protein